MKTETRIYHCSLCNRHFGTPEALRQHNESTGHGSGHECTLCSRSFKDRQALKQHLDSSPVHMSSAPREQEKQPLPQAVQPPPPSSAASKTTGTHTCVICQRQFGTQKSLKQHVADSHAHTADQMQRQAQRHKCAECEVQFGSLQELDEHLVSSPAHLLAREWMEREMHINELKNIAEQMNSLVLGEGHAHRCDDCGQTFDHADKLVGHLKSPDLPDHVLSFEGGSWFMYPALNQLVLQNVDSRSLRPFAPHFDKQVPAGGTAAQNSRNRGRDYTTCILGHFTCRDMKRCGGRWTSGRVAIRIRGGSGNNGYNAVVFNQRCRKCKRLGKLDIDATSYVDRVSYRIDKWNGVLVKPKEHSEKETPPHRSSLCEACKRGCCVEQKQGWLWT